MYVFLLLQSGLSGSLLVFLCDWLRSTKSASQSDVGGFPVASSSMTVESKCVLHTKLVVFASIESVLSEK